MPVDAATQPTAKEQQGLVLLLVDGVEVGGGVLVRVPGRSRRDASSFG